MSSAAIAISTQLEDAIESGASPIKFLEFLQGLLNDDLAVDSDQPLQADIYAPLIDGLSQHFLDAFPYTSGLAWEALEEKVDFTRITLQVIERAAARVNGLFVGRENLARSTFIKLLDLWCVVDAWTEAAIAGATAEGPRVLMQMARNALLGVLRRCADSDKAPNHGEGGDAEALLNENVRLGPKILVGIIDECLAVHADILLVSSTTYPIGLYFFELPHLRSSVAQEVDESSSTTSHIRIMSVAQLHSMQLKLLEVLSSLAPETGSPGLLLSDVFKKSVQAATRSLQFFQSSICKASPAQRYRYIAGTISATRSLFVASTSIGTFHVAVMSLLQHRLREGPKAEVDVVDNALQDFILALQHLPAPQTNVQCMVDALLDPSWNESTSTLPTSVISYVSWLSTSMSVEDAKRLRASLLPKALDGKQDLLDALEARISCFSTGGEQAASPTFVFGDVLDFINQVTNANPHLPYPQLPNFDSWRVEVLTVLLENIGQGFETLSTEMRIGITEILGQIPCMLVHPLSTTCVTGTFSSFNLNGLSSFCASICNAMYSDKTLQATPSVICACLDALSAYIRHDPENLVPSFQESFLKPLYRFTDHRDRAVRIAAGRALVVFADACRTARDIAPADEVFSRLNEHLAHPQPSVRETGLLSVALMGRTNDHQLLGTVVCCLLYQLAQTNAFVRSRAYVQLTDLAKYHQRSGYHLVSPYFPQISYYLVSHITSNYLLLSETCRFVSLVPAAFIKLTSKQTFPQLFAERRLDVLTKIADELQQKLHSLFLDGELPSIILAHIFLLDDPEVSKAALDFVVDVMVQGTENASADINQQQIVRSHLTPLLTELVVAMGDTRLSNDRPVSALLRVQQMVEKKQNLSVLLESQMLAVIAYMGDMLQDVRGKRPLDVKRQIIRSIGHFVKHIGPRIALVSPQIMATLRNNVLKPELADDTLRTWLIFVKTLSQEDTGSTVGPTSASLVAIWSTLGPAGQSTTKKIFNYFISNVSAHFDEVVDLEGVKPLADCAPELVAARRTHPPEVTLHRILDSSWNDNWMIASQALAELKKFMLENQPWIRDAASGDMFHPSISKIVASLLHAACREGDGSGVVRSHAYECISVLGAVDPDRFDPPTSETRMLVHHNFTDESESTSFALYLIKAVLVGAFRSTTDSKYQAQLAYAIQELSHFCKFTPALVSAGPNHSVPIKVRKRWDSLSKDTLEIVTPLLASRYSRKERPIPPAQFPIYSSQATYREWVQQWTLHLITVSSGEGKVLFDVFQSAVVYKDIGVAYHILPHLVLHALISSDERAAENIRSEILVVLEDQVESHTTSSKDKKALSAQVVFMVMDHLSRWVRYVRQSVQAKRSDGKKSRGPLTSSEIEEQLSRVDSVLSSINSTLIAQAALKCGAYARSLMNFESQILSMETGAMNTPEATREYYECLHEIYARLDEPDGMEGVSTRILSPSLEHQIRQHESMGRWTAAQSCWEVRLQQSPNELDYHVGLLRCLSNLGHYDTLRTHIKGVLVRNPDWEIPLASFQVEASWILGDWRDVETLVTRTSASPPNPNISLAKTLLAVRSGDRELVATTLCSARDEFGARISALGVDGYRQCYDSVLLLHHLHEIEIIHDLVDRPTQGSPISRNDCATRTMHFLSSRFESTLPAFRIREAILSMRRTAFKITSPERFPSLRTAVNDAWLASARVARKAGYSQTAYSAVLQAQQGAASFSFIQSAKLVKSTGEHLRALQELENSMHRSGLILGPRTEVVDLTPDEETSKKMKAKAQLLRARWMKDSDRYDAKDILSIFREAARTDLQWESGQFHLGHYQDECFKQLPDTERRGQRGAKMIFQTIQCFSKAIQYGSKHVYETVPRFLSLWLDMGEDRNLSTSDMFKHVNLEVQKAIQQAPVYKWFTAFPQIVSRIGHTNTDAFSVLTILITTVLQEYPDQGLWLFISVVKSTKTEREQRGKGILNRLKTAVKNRETRIPKLIDNCINMTNELLALCDHPVSDGNKRLNMRKDFPKLFAMASASLIIPLQESLTVSLPPISSTTTSHQPFSLDSPRFHEFGEEIEVMRSLAKPRKISVVGSDGQIYIFLGKPKDDLRKDARLMDFNSIINNLLKKKSESRRRKLHIRTYSVVTLNEECGFIQWVPNTIPFRSILVRNYEGKGIKNWSTDLSSLFTKIKEMEETKAADFWRKEVLSQFPPVFHEWFVETFPEPSAWLASRMTYGRTAAVMSMVGFILGLGDRHLENILLDVNSGDVVHVDFNCLFERGKQLETPERVPFRLTQNMVDGLGVTGVEGVFRIACEVSMQLLRDNKDCLMNVLEAFIHDPLVEWEEEKRKADRIAQKRNSNNVKQSTNLRKLATDALGAIEKKLRAMYKPYDPRSRAINYKDRDSISRELSTSDLVEVLIQDSAKDENLAKMYPGWAAWH